MSSATPRLDVLVEAAGFSKKMAKELDAYIKEVVGTHLDTKEDADDCDGEDNSSGEDVKDFHEADSDPLERKSSSEERYLEQDKGTPKLGGDDTHANELHSFNLRTLELQLDSDVKPLEPPSIVKTDTRAAKRATGWSI